MLKRVIIVFLFVYALMGQTHTDVINKHQCCFTQDDILEQRIVNYIQTHCTATGQVAPNRYGELAIHCN